MKIALAAVLALALATGAQAGKPATNPPVVTMYDYPDGLGTSQLQVRIHSDVSHGNPSYVTVTYPGGSLRSDLYTGWIPDNPSGFTTVSHVFFLPTGEDITVTFGRNSITTFTT